MDRFTNLNNRVLADFRGKIDSISMILTVTLRPEVAKPVTNPDP